MRVEIVLSLLTVLFAGIVYLLCRQVVSSRMARAFMQHPYLPNTKERKDFRFAWLNDVQNQAVLLRVPGELYTVIGSCSVLGVGGAYLGWLWFFTLPSVLIMTLIMGVLPIVILYMLSIRRLVKIRLSFLHAMEVFYQAYVSVPHRNIRVVIAKIVQENRMPSPIRPLFHELHDQLLFGNKAALKKFSMTLNHEWGYTFAHFLETGLEEGVQLDEGLQQFIHDLRDAQASAWLDRNRLLEIRIANFSPPLVVALFIGVNFYFNPVAANHAYFQDIHGRILLMQSVVLMILSFAMGIWLSLRRA